MSDNSLTRLNRIASEILPGQQIEATARGEDYYVFVITGAQGLLSAFPQVWIDPNASDQQVKDKLSREFEQAFHPNSSPDDLSVPNLQTEANRPKLAEEPVKPPAASGATLAGG
jgi:hypothetical protein